MFSGMFLVNTSLKPSDFEVQSLLMNISRIIHELSGIRKRNPEGRYLSMSSSPQRASAHRYILLTKRCLRQFSAFDNHCSARQHQGVFANYDNLLMLPFYRYFALSQGCSCSNSPVIRYNPLTAGLQKKRQE